MGRWKEKPSLNVVLFHSTTAVATGRSLIGFHGPQFEGMGLVYGHIQAGNRIS